MFFLGINSIRELSCFKTKSPSFSCKDKLLLNLFYTKVSAVKTSDESGGSDDLLELFNSHWFSQ